MGGRSSARGRALSLIRARRLSRGGRSSTPEFLHAAQGLTVDGGNAVLAAPDEVGIEPDHGEAAAGCAAFDRFQQEGRALPPMPQLQEGRDRGQQVAHQGGAQDAGLAGLIGRGERARSRASSVMAYSSPPVA